MTNPYRAMCAELAEYVFLLDEPPRELVIRALALLDEPEPEGLSDEELLTRAIWQFNFSKTNRARFLDIARATIAADRAIRPRPQPEPEGLSDEYLLGLACEAYLVYSRTDGSGFATPYREECDIQVEVLDYARAAIAADRARWGRPAPQPVPVSERLPGAEDCDADGRCWLLFRSASIRMTPVWSLVQSRSIFDGPYNHWLPANALPTPEATND